jgi:Uma2 family endonuclease
MLFVSGHEMAATITDRITWDSFEKIPDDAMHREILDGELLVLPPARSSQTRIAHRAAKLLAPVEESHYGSVLIEAGYKLSSHLPTWIQPDVSILSTDRFNASTPDGYFHDGPELAIEVVSPSETARDLNRKIDLLLASGTLAVWVIYPDDEEVRVFLPNGDSFASSIHGILTVPEPLGSLKISVALLFEK